MDAAGAASVDRAPFENFLFHEAALLDARRFRDWMALFADDGTYWVPAVPNQDSPFNQASLFYDDRELMKTRVDRLEHPRIHVQTPPSRTAHLIGNIAVEQADETKGEYRHRLDRHHGRVPRRTSARVRRPPEPSAAPRRRRLPHRPEAGRPDQLRLRLRGDGGSFVFFLVVPRVAVRINAPFSSCGARFRTDRACGA